MGWTLARRCVRKIDEIVIFNSKKQKMNQEEQLDALIEPMPLYSHHIFLFPFKWKNLGLLDKSLEEQTEIDSFRMALKGSEWKRLNPFKINTLSNYNQFNYFHDFVREVLYDMDKDEKGLSDLEFDNNNAHFLDHYSYKLPLKSKYIINVKENTYVLELENIVIQVYQTGVGIISYHLNNRLYSESNKVLAINQYGRRLFPPFFTIPNKKVGQPNFLEQKGFFNEINNTKSIEIPDSICLKLGEKSLSESFKNYGMYSNFKNRPFQLPVFIKDLFEPKLLTTSNDPSNGKFFISPVLDDRMFTICWYGNNHLSNLLARKIHLSKRFDDAHRYGYENSNWWYEFVFLDKERGKSCQNDALMTEILRGATNARWANYCTFYGVSRYSFVCLTNELDTLKSGYSEFVVTHIQTIYYKMVELALLQKACVLRYSDEATRLSTNITSNDLPAKVSDLLSQYIRFINKIYFREVTSQDQGIELYALLQKQMDIERHVKDLDGEIQELHGYVILQKEKQRNEFEEQRNIHLERLTNIATAFAIASLVMAFFGMNYFGGGEDALVLYPTGNFAKTSLIFTVSLIAIIVGVSAYLSYNFYKRKK
jgi:hypothetical protein